MTQPVPRRCSTRRGIRAAPTGVRFETEIVHQPRYDLNYTELLISYWDAIGVKAEVVILPLAEHVAARTQGNYELITAEGAYKGSAAAILGKFLSTSWNTSEVDDEWYRAKFEEYQAATTLDEQNGALRELEMYSIEQFLAAGRGGGASILGDPAVGRGIQRRVDFDEVRPISGFRAPVVR